MLPDVLKSLAIVAVTIAFVSGCQESRPGSELPVFPVTGKLLFEGNPAAGARITLHARDAVAERKVYPSAVVQEDGTFRLSTFVNADGAPAGEYVAIVFWPDPKVVAKDPFGESENPPPDLLRGRFASPDKSNLRITVPESALELATVDLDDREVRTQKPYSLSATTK